MSGARALMRHRLTTLRNQAVGEDPWGGPSDQEWQANLTEQPCRAWFQSGKREISNGDNVVLSDLRVIVPLSADVTTNDRLGDVTDRLGNVILPGPLLIDEIAPRADHKVLFVKEVS